MRAMRVTRINATVMEVIMARVIMENQKIRVGYRMKGIGMSSAARDVEIGTRVPKTGTRVVTTGI